MNFVSGRGRDTMPFLMKTGDIDALAFIGGSKAADDLIRQHPYPHRLKVFLQLEAKNMGVSFFIPYQIARSVYDSQTYWLTFDFLLILRLVARVDAYLSCRFSFPTCLNHPKN